MSDTVDQRKRETTCVEMASAKSVLQGGGKNINNDESLDNLDVNFINKLVSNRAYHYYNSLF